MLELRCRDVNDCNFIAQGQTHEQVVTAWADHASKRHGMKYLPPEFNLQIRQKLQTIQLGQELELRCRDVHECDFIAQGQTPEQVLVDAAKHASEMHGLMSFPPQWYVQMRLHMRAVQD